MVELISDTGCERQRALRFCRQSLNFACHKIDHVIGQRGVGDRSEPVSPAALSVIEGEETLLLKCLQKLADEKWISGCLLQHQSCQRFYV